MHGGRDPARLWLFIINPASKAHGLRRQGQPGSSQAVARSPGIPPPLPPTNPTNPQHSTAQHSTAQHSPAQPSPAQPSTQVEHKRMVVRSAYHVAVWCFLV